MKLKALLPLVLGALAAVSGAVLYYGAIQIGLGIFLFLMGLAVFGVGVRRTLLGALKAARRQQSSTRKTAEEVALRHQEIRKISDRLRAIKSDPEALETGCALPGFRPPQVPAQPKASLLLPVVLSVAGLLLVLFYQPLTAPLQDSAWLLKLERGAYADAWIEPWSGDFALVERADLHRGPLLTLLASDDNAVARGAARILLAADPYGEVVPDTLFGRFVALNQGPQGQQCMVYRRDGEYRVFMRSLGEFWSDHLWRRRGFDPGQRGDAELQFQEVSYSWGMNTDESAELDADLERIMVLCTRNLGSARRQLEQLASGQRPRLPYEARQIALLLLEELQEGAQSFHRPAWQLSGLPPIEVVFEEQSHSEAVIGVELLAHDTRALVAYGDGLLQLISADMAGGTLARLGVAQSGEDLTCIGARASEESGIQLLTGSSGGTLGFWRVLPGGDRLEMTHSQPSAGGFISAVSLAAQIDYALCGQGASLQLYYVIGDDLRRVNTERLPAAGLGFATFGTGRKVLLSTDVGHVALGAVRNGVLVLDDMPWPVGAVASAGALLHDGNLAVLGLQTGGLLLRQIDSRRNESQPAHSARIQDLAVSADEQWLLTGSEDGSAVFWQLDALGSCAARGVLSVPQAIRCVALSEDGGRALLGLQDGTLILCATDHLQAR